MSSLLSLDNMPANIGSQLFHMVVDHSQDAGTLLIFLVIIGVGMILGPCIGYIIQCYKIMKEPSNADGFSPFICLILLVANIFRVFWWYVINPESLFFIHTFLFQTQILTLRYRFAEGFSVVLLIASVLMLACQVRIIKFKYHCITKMNKPNIFKLE